MEVSVLLVNGETMGLEVTPEMRGWQLKQQIKEMAGRTWDEVTRSTTVVEVVVGDRLLGNDEKVAEGLASESSDTILSVVFKPNIARCSEKSAIASFRSESNLGLLFMVDIPHDETQIAERAFEDCKELAKLTIPDSVTRVGDGAFSG